MHWVLHFIDRAVMGKDIKHVYDPGSWFRERHMIHPQPMKHTEMPLRILQRRLTFSRTWMWKGLSSGDAVTITLLYESELKGREVGGRAKLDL